MIKVLWRNILAQDILKNKARLVSFVVNRTLTNVTLLCRRKRKLYADRVRQGRRVELLVFLIYYGDSARISSILSQ